jgi:hypothetical protein
MVVSNQKGQTLVEYILLIVVAVSLVMTFYRSSAFQKLFGKDGDLGKKMKNQNEFSYRHAFYKQLSQDIPRDTRDVREHPSYKGDDEPTRFFGPRNPYGLQ